MGLFMLDQWVITGKMIAVVMAAWSCRGGGIGKVNRKRPPRVGKEPSRPRRRVSRAERVGSYMEKVTR